MRLRWHARSAPTSVRRVLGMTPLLLILLVALASCMRVERALTINGDGSGVYVLTVGFRQPTSGDPQSIPTNDIAAMEAFGAHVERQGGTYRRYDMQGYSYWSFTRPFTSLTQADALLQEDPRQDDQTHFPLLYHDQLHVAVESELARASTVHVTGTISLADLTGQAKKNWSDATESITITLPDGVSAHQGGAQDGNSVTYKIAYNESATVDVTGSVPQASGANPAGLALVLALLALVLALLGCFLLLRRRAPATTGHSTWSS
jgi:hypothetical protein